MFSRLSAIVRAFPATYNQPFTSVQRLGDKWFVFLMEIDFTGYQVCNNQTKRLL